MASSEWMLIEEINFGCKASTSIDGEIGVDKKALIDEFSLPSNSHHHIVYSVCCLYYQHIHCLTDMTNASFVPNFPSELTVNVFSLLTSSRTYDHAVRDIDIGFFPAKDEELLSQMRKLFLVNKTFAANAFFSLLKVVHLRGEADIKSFYLATSPNAITTTKWVSELQLEFDGKEKDIVAVVDLCATILTRLSALSKLDLSTSHPLTFLALYEVPNGASAYDNLWMSIPPTIKHILVQNATFVPFLYSTQYNDRVQIMDRFVAGHLQLDTWSFYSWRAEEDDYIHDTPSREELFGNDVNALMRNNDYSLEFANEHFFRLLQNCKALEIKGREKERDPGDDEYPPVCKQWVHPNITYLSCNFVHFWPKDFRCETIQTLRCTSPNHKQVRSLLKQLPNLSTFIYDPSEITDSTSHNAWRKGISSATLRHVMAFIRRCDYDGWYDRDVNNILSIPSLDEIRPEQSAALHSFTRSIYNLLREFLALEDRDRFPSLEKLSLYIHPSESTVPTAAIKNKLESALRAAFRIYAGTGVEFTIEWGACKFHTI